MYGNEALSINQWYKVEFNNTDCQYVGYNVSDINELVPECAPDEIVNFVEILTGLYTAYEKNVACSGEDILEIYNFKPVSAISLLNSKFDNLLIFSHTSAIINRNISIGI